MNTTGTKERTLRHVFFVGAGASLAAPSGLPLFSTLRDTLCEWMEIERRSAERLPPEVFMHCVAKGSVPLAHQLAEVLRRRGRTGIPWADHLADIIQRRLTRHGTPASEWLAEMLGSGEPNAVHAVLARALRKGDVVWSLNVDELIERAVEINDPEFARELRSDLTAHAGDEGAPSSRQRPLKPHGTLRLRNFVFETTQVIRPLSEAWASRLVEDFAHADEVVFVGYRGADVDLRVPLEAALRAGPSVRWFAAGSKEDLEDARRFLPSLPKMSNEQAPLASNPSIKFVEWSDNEGLGDYITSEQRSGLLDTTPREVPPPKARPRLPRALLLELLNQNALAEDALVAEMVRGRHLWTCAFRFFKLRWYAGDRRLRPLRALDRSPMVGALPDPAKRRLRRAHLMYLSSVKGDHEQALPLARRSDKGDPATWIVIAKALRTTGDCVGALRAARRAFELAAPKSRHDPSRADERAHAKFEEVMALTWLGRLEEARSALGTLYDGYDSQARIRWRGWARYVNGGLQVLDGRGRDALSELAAAYEFFEADDSSGQRKVACKLVEAAAKRILGDTSAAARIRISRGIDPVLLDLRAALDFELAEAAREQGPARYDEAERRYRAAASVAKRPLLNCAALIGLAELEHGRGDDGRPTLERARELALEHGFRRLQVDAVVTAYRIRLVSRDKAALQLSDLLDALPRFGLDTPSVDRVLDEPNHRLVCVW